MTKLPNGWEWKKIIEISEYRRGSFPQPYGNKEWYGGDGSMPFVQVADVGDNFLLKDLTKQNISTLAQPKSVFVEKGSVIVTLQGTIGKVAITQYDCFMDRTLAVFTKFLSDIDKKYFAYQLKSRFDIEKKEARGATIKTITKEEFSNFTIPFPPLEEQRKIVKILDEKFASIDESIRLAKDDLLSLDELWQSILNYSFNLLKSKLDNDTYTLPPTWKWKKLGDISIIVGGGTPSKNNSEFWENGTISWASVRDMNDDFILKTELSITQKGLECSSANLVDDRYVIIATRVGLGKVCLINNPISFNQDLKGILPSDKLNKIFLFYYFKNIASYLVGMGIGATVKGIKLDVVKNIQIPLPPLKEQENIAKELESKAKTIKELKELYTKRLKDYEELKESLLDLAFKGGL